jgi:hypothetical protein
MMYPSTRIDRSCWRDFAPAIALLVISAMAVVAITLSPSGDEGQYVVVAPPWYNRTKTLIMASSTGGDVVDVGYFANVAIVHSNNLRFVAALYHSGAWLVIDPMELRGCLGFKQRAAPNSGGM